MELEGSFPSYPIRFPKSHGNRARSNIAEIVIAAAAVAVVGEGKKLGTSTFMSVGPFDTHLWHGASHFFISLSYVCMQNSGGLW